MNPFRLALMLVLIAASPVAAQTASDDGPVPGQCLAIARSLPGATFASYRPRAQGLPLVAAQATSAEVTITYAGHSTYVIETPAGLRIATDFSGHFGTDPLPDVVTMNKAHRTHYTDTPDPRIGHVYRGWNPDGDGPARHAETIEDAYIRNVPTDIRRWGGALEVGGNSIFIFEVAGLCIGHLGHLHHHLEDAHYAAIGRLDIVMVPIDGGMTLSVDGMSAIAKRLMSSIILPMHRHATPLSEFTGRMGEAFAVEFRDTPAFTVSLRTLPRRPTVLVLKGV